LSRANPPSQPAPGRKGRATSGAPGKGSPPPKPFIPLWVWWLLLLATLAWNGYELFVPKTGSSLSLTYSEFLERVRAGQVASVTFSGQNTEGAFKQPITISAEPASDAAPAAAPQPAGVKPGTYQRFTTVLPPIEDQRLLPLLEQQGIAVSAKDVSGGSWLFEIAINFLPMLLFVGLLFMMGRSAQRSQQSLFGFGASKARMYNSERPAVTFADVAGANEAKAELQEIVSFLKEPGRYRALGARLPRGVLLVGPPGTGKTLLARAVAGEANVPFYSISASEFVEMFVGVGASRVRDLFTKAKQEAPAIIFVDEIDAVGRQRGAGLGGSNDEREQTLNQMLVEMDGFDDQTSVIVLAATNRPDVLDPALLRPGRFDRQVTLGLPDRSGREAILRIHTRHLPLAPDVSHENLSRRTPGFAGADLSNLANEAALNAARRGANTVAMEDFDDAMDKIVLGTRQGILLSEEERRLVAYHEGGHALVAKLTPGADPVNKITIIPHGRALGATEQLPEEDRHNYPREYLLGRLAVMLGGRAAEELVFDQPTTGAENDIKQATNLARRMVGVWGMSPAVGPVSYGLGETHPFLGREIAQGREYSDETAAALDRAIRGIIEEAYRQARTTLEMHRSLLDALAAELVAHETVDSQQLDALLAQHGSAPVEPGIVTTLPAA
jgi:cell division protease FtsH